MVEPSQGCHTSKRLGRSAAGMHRVMNCRNALLPTYGTGEREVQLSRLPCAADTAVC